MPDASHIDADTGLSAHCKEVRIWWANNVKMRKIKGPKINYWMIDSKLNIKKKFTNNKIFVRNKIYLGMKFLQTNYKTEKFRILFHIKGELSLKNVSDNKRV